MGRIRTGFVKRTSNELIKRNPGKFQKDFNKNKHLVEEAADVKTKKLRNLIAGYITKKLKIGKDMSNI